jgi:hypothetical protein
MLNKSGEGGHPCLITDFRGNGFSFSLLNVGNRDLYNENYKQLNKEIKEDYRR